MNVYDTANRLASEIKESEEKYIQYFKDRDWNEFDIEQMKFDGETLHICTF